MSFQGNGGRRYGYVPPQQYGVPGGQDPNNPNQGLQRQSSFRSGDDGAIPNSNNARYPNSASGMATAMPNDESYMSNQTPTSPTRGSFNNANPAMSGYQHQYQPFPAGPQSPGAAQTTYNPQQFARTQSQLQTSQYRPQPPVPSQSQSPMQSNPSLSLNNAPFPAVQPYNPANYQQSQPPPVPARQHTVSGYGSYSNTSYATASTPLASQNPTYWPSGQQYGIPPTPTNPSPYDQPLASPSYSQPNSAPLPPTLPPRQNLYTQSSNSLPYPTNGENFSQGDYAATPVATQAPYPNFSAYSPQPGYPASANPAHQRSPAEAGHQRPAPIPIPAGPQAASEDTSRLARHPTLRPLPSAPAQAEVSDEDEWRLPLQGHGSESLTQEQLFADIGNALARASPANYGQQKGDLLDGELGDSQQIISRNTSSTTAASGDKFSSSASTLFLSHAESTDDYDDDDESDLEAAAGLEAMRIAEEQEAQRGGGPMSFGSQSSFRRPHLTQSQDESSDSDKNIDLGLVGGGYDAHMSYGQGLDDLLTSHSGEMEDQSRPLPTPHEIERSNSHNHNPPAGLGGMADYSIPGAGAIHPFPAFENATVGEYGTGGLQRPTSGIHRLSFDEGDEQSLRSRISDSRASDRSESENSSRDDMPELFYHPGMGSSPYNMNRPLPAVPPMSENKPPQLLAAGSYRNQQYSNSYGTAASNRSSYVPQGPEGYVQDTLSPSGQYVPRSASLISHSNTPQTVPPIRSKTDAEERARAQRAANARQIGVRGSTAMEGFDMSSATPQSTITLDLPALPAGRRKKFSPSRLSSADFRKCPEPWALSGIASWIREMAGGETGEGEPDLRQKTIEDGLVALFTHKVPTMNTADAETLSQKVVKTMFDAGILIPEEEWVKFGLGSVSGVLWQLTGSGCYSPKVHEFETHGRCYSHHCSRTLKKVNLQKQTLEPSRKTEDWATFFNVTKEHLEGANKKEIQRQNNLHEIVMSEDTYMGQINILRVLYRDDLSTWQPPIISKSKISKFITSVFGKVEAIKEVNENYLLAQLKYRQKEQGPWIIGFSDIFREWIRKARTAYIEYASGFPYASYLVRREADRNLLFRQFLDQARDNKLSGRLDWNTYLKAPITRLQRYTLLLGTVLANMTQDTEEKTQLATAIDEIKAVTFECDAKVDEQSKKVEIIELQSKLSLRHGMEDVRLNLDHLGRELLFEGDLQRAGANRFTWLETHAILFDHYFILAKSNVHRDSSASRREFYDVSKLPIPMELLVLESTNDDPVIKSSVKGIGAVTTVTKAIPASAVDQRPPRPSTSSTLERANTLEPTTSNNSVATMSSVTRLNASNSNDGDARSMYPFRVKHLGKTEVYTLYAPSAQNRQEWCDKIIEAKTRHAASLFAQNAEPFRLRVMADTAFAYDVATAGAQKPLVNIEGTPLDRAIRDMEGVYGGGPRIAPICRALVNCATAFTSNGKQTIAIGTDYGVYTAEMSNPRGWTRAIQIARVTQIAVLEEFSLCLIIADKALIAYHLDVVAPNANTGGVHTDSARRAPQKLSGNRDVSFFATARMKERTLVFYKKREGLHSTFKVLEPVFQKSTEKRSRIFGKKLGAGVTEFFREFDEFYIPTECFTINLFHTYIAISTQKGFELMTLDKKVPISIPDLRNPATESIANRIANQRPLGMFRLSDTEFLLCYDECGVYVDKHGDVSRSVIMMFVGKAKHAAMYGAYLVLFDTDFVEIRNAENGRLRQIIAGRDIRCLDYGVNPLGAGSAGGYQSAAPTVDNTAERRTLKLAMAHPEVQGNQIVLEMVLNEGHSE